MEEQSSAGAGDSEQRLIRVLLAGPPDSCLWALHDELQRDGLEVVTALDALQCVARLRHGQPDVLLLDLHLTWGQASGVLALMQEQPEVPEIPAIVVVSDDAGPPGVLGLPFQAHVCEQTPLEPARLLQRIRELV